MRRYKYFLIALLLILFTGKSFASHFYGVDLFYTHVSGNTYRVSIVAFGDCSGEQFPSFSATRPRIYIRKGNTDFLTDFLEQEPPKAGIEVTPVCPAELNNTTCVNPAGTVPGVKKFVYSKEFTLDGPAPDWKFIFLGETDGTTVAGRSNSLTNVSPPGVISLEATLNNTQNANSSPLYTTIATPFYCLNRPTNFNPGAIDADGDSLVYELVPGMNKSTPLTYNQGFSGSNPLDVSPGAFSFSSTTGQLTFTPNSIQRSLVVYRVSEYRNGVLIGTSMREMTVVIMPCSNNPPLGYISNTAEVAVVDNVTVKVCSGNREVAFSIDPADADSGHIINMTVNGLPKDAKIEVVNNNTTRPRSRFVWKMPDLPLGDYTFFVTYTDNGCPIASRQTQAYTIRIINEDVLYETINANCTGQGLVKVIFPQGWSPWAFKVYRDAATVYNMKGFTNNTWSDSLQPGTYKVEAVNSFGCSSEKMVDIPSACDVVDLPTAFSPNGDGENDLLFVRGRNIQEMHLRIYNRWGQLVFENSDMNRGWDGNFNGKDAPIEAYAYVLSVVFKSGQVFQKLGNITLLR